MSNTNVKSRARTELHEAAVDANVELLRKLLSSGSDPSASDFSGWTPLHFAAQAQSLDCAALLVEAGANLNAQDEHGNTPLFRAVFSSQGDGAVIQLLLRSGAKPDMKNKHGISPLDLAKSIANYDIERFFAIEK